MALEKLQVIKDTHSKTVTALAYNPVKHELLAGCEDGMIKAWDYSAGEPGKLIRSSHEHSGWITTFMFWNDAKLMLSASNDGTILAWGSGGQPHDKLEIGAPVYALAWNVRRNQLIIGMCGAVRVYEFRDLNIGSAALREYNLLQRPARDHGHIVKDKAFTAKDHTDIVRNIVCHETRVYTAGYDRKLLIYDSFSYPGKKGLKLLSRLYPAHDAGITCLVLARDQENTWLLTGGFDKTVKVWSQDGQIMHRFDIFSSTITGLCYVRPTKTIWVAAGTPEAPMYDPKSGDNVSEFIGTFQNEDEETERLTALEQLTVWRYISDLEDIALKKVWGRIPYYKYDLSFLWDHTCPDRYGPRTMSIHARHDLLLLQYIPDIGQVFGSNVRRNLLMWKYNPSGCITALRNKYGVETLTYTKKVPILIFSGDAEGQISRWERLQSNTFMYSKEILPRTEAVGRLAAQISAKYDWAAMDKMQIRDQLLQKQKPSFANKLGKIDSSATHRNIALLKAVFVEDLDLLVVSSEDQNIYVWGFDDDAVQVLQKMQPTDYKLDKKFEILLTIKEDNTEEKIEDKDAPEHDSVTNRVAGFICKHVFTEHSQVISGLAVVGQEAGYGTTYLISTGWDRRILLWDLEKLRLHDMFRNRDKGFLEDEELAADGIILDLTYCKSRNEFAYAASDKLVYIRKFSPNGSEMTLSAVLQGHEAEVTQVKNGFKVYQYMAGLFPSHVKEKGYFFIFGLSMDFVLETAFRYDSADVIHRVQWNPVVDKWVTGSEDGTIRIWSANGMTCELVLGASGSVTALCIDKTNGCIVAGVQDTIRVYDLEYRKIVQTNLGHTDSVRNIIHIPERQQYVSASWDKTVRIWNAYNKTARRKVNRNSQDGRPKKNEDGSD